MNEDEAKEFIAAEVRKSLLQWLGIVVSVLGIANVVAFWKLSNDVSSEAHKVAERNVKIAVDEEIAKQKKGFADITDEANKFRTEFGSLYELIGNTSSDLKHMQGTSQELEAKIKTLTPNILSLLWRWLTTFKLLLPTRPN